MTAFLPVVYTLFWALVLQILRLNSSPFLDTAVKRDNALTGLHALIVPVLASIYYLQLENPLAYEATVDTTLKHIISISIGFFIFSIFNMYRVYEKPDKASLMHHVIIGLGFGMPLWYFTDCPAFYFMLLIPQFTGVFYHSHFLFRKTKGVNPYWTKLTFDLNFYFWILLRFVVYGLFLVLAVYYEWTQPKFSSVEAIITGVFLLSAFYFHVFWLQLAIRARRRQKNPKQQLVLTRA